MLRLRLTGPALPAALLFIGIAASIGMGCVTSAVVNSVQAQRAAEARRNALKDHLAKALPPPAFPGTKTADRIKVEGDFSPFTVTAVGNFTPESTKAFLENARTYYVFNRKPDLLITLFRDTAGGRELAGTYPIKPAEELMQRVKSLIPPLPSGLAPARLTITANLYHFDADVDSCNIFIRGAPSAEDARVIVAALSPLADSLTKPFRFTVAVYNSALRPQGPLELYDSGLVK